MSHGKILVVDDDRWLVDVLARELETAGYEVKRAEHTIDAIQAVDTFCPDVITLDLFMPGPNGIVLLHELQSHSDLSRIPVVVCTNSAHDLPTDSLEQYGVRRILDKTRMHPSDIVAAVRRCMA